MKTWALLPVKGISNAKQRLDGVLNPAQREQLFLALLVDLLDCVRASRLLSGALVVGAEPRLQALVEQAGAVFLAEPADVSGLNAAVGWGLQQLAAMGVARALVLHGDLPLATTAEIDCVLETCPPERCDLALLPDWRGDGTNAMLCPLPVPISLHYGEGSFQKHWQQAVKAQLQVCKLSPSTLAFDVDTPQDLALLLPLVAKGYGGERTRSVVRDWPEFSGLADISQQWREMTTHLGLTGV